MTKRREQHYNRSIVTAGLGRRVVPSKEDVGWHGASKGVLTRTGGTGGVGRSWPISISGRETPRIVVLDAHPYNRVGTHTWTRYTERVMHIRRLPGNGFGLLMTGQLS